MGKVAPDKYIEITSSNIEKVGKKPSSNYITKSECNDQIINRVDQNKTEKLDKITELTNKYYDNLLNTEKDNIGKLKDQISNINTNINTTYNNLCNKYDTINYKSHLNYNIIKFTKNTSLNLLDKINLSELAQKTVKLKEINTNQKNKKFNKTIAVKAKPMRFQSIFAREVINARMEMSCKRRINTKTRTATRAKGKSMSTKVVLDGRAWSMPATSSEPS